MVKAGERAIKKVGEKEKRFRDVLEDIFIGASIEGKSGFINMMRINHLILSLFYHSWRKMSTENL
jgi:hypothetical protein